MAYVTMPTAIAGIMDGIETALRAEIKTGGRLSTVLTLARGERAPPKPPVPAIWFYSDTLSCYDSTMNLREEWEMPVILCGIVRNDNPETGSEAATALAATARQVLLLTRNLSLGYVRGLHSVRFEPCGPQHRDGSLYGALAVVNIKFVAQES